MKRLILITLSASVLLAQSGTSTISGIINDPTGSPIPSAKVKVVNEQTGSSIDQETNEAGLYRAGSLVPRAYRIEIEASSFQKIVGRPVTLEVGQVIALDRVLHDGPASETVKIAT